MPPAVGTVEACRERCLAYPDALLLVTMAETADIADLTATLDTREEHEAVTRAANRLVRLQGAETYVLSTESCAICGRCSYPDGPAATRPDVSRGGEPRYSDHGPGGAVWHRFQAGSNIVTWFSLILYR